MKVRLTLAIWLALLASFIIWSLIDLEARNQLCKATGGYVSNRNTFSFECVKDPT